MALASRDGRRIIVPPPIASASAIGRFGNYKKEEPVALRQAVVSGSTLDDLRTKREMLRSMTPEQAMSVIEFHKDLTVFEALALAKKEGKLIVPNFVHDRILTEINSENYLLANYPAWTGTMVLYNAPGKPFGEKIVYGWEDRGIPFSISLDVPARFRGKIDCALVIEHPDFDLALSGNNDYVLIAGVSRIHLHERFPEKSGEFYRNDEQYRLPSGRIVNDCESSRRLWRLNGDFIGLVARGFDDLWSDYIRRGVGLDDGPSGVLGVALF